ncbi:MAG: HAD-IA family hydrolase [Candidatus Gracilibacteria bacterium]|nr:HAD-IA family hydrolase [Candidatus Gracilibacteria bacterium]
MIDKSREGLTLNKISHTLKVFLSKEATNAILFVDKFGDINFDFFKENGKKGIILDIDECVAPHHGNILDENMKIIKNIFENGWKIVIYSNMKKTSRYEDLEKLGIKVITSKYAKPDERGFKECLENLSLDTKSTLMIGDNFLTDGGAIYAGIEFIKVKPIETEEKNRKIARQVQLLMREIIDKIANIRNNN